VGTMALLPVTLTRMLLAHGAMMMTQRGLPGGRGTGSGSHSRGFSDRQQTNMSKHSPLSGGNAATALWTGKLTIRSGIACHTDALCIVHTGYCAEKGKCLKGSTSVSQDSACGSRNMYCSPDTALYSLHPAHNSSQAQLGER
jgi:hypothetical protein